MIRINLTAGTPRVGLWCDTCALPSRYSIPVHVMSLDGPRQIGSVAKCGECSDVAGTDQETPND